MCVRACCHFEATENGSYLPNTSHLSLCLRQYLTVSTELHTGGSCRFLVLFVTVQQPGNNDPLSLLSVMTSSRKLELEQL